MKVYCKYCSYYYEWADDRVYGEGCSKLLEAKKMRNYRETYTVEKFPKPSQQNKENNCPYYKKKWWVFWI